MKCQSEECYEEIFGAEELEPGEIDHVRTRKFTTCVAQQGKRQVQEERARKRGKVGTEPREGNAAREEGAAESAAEDAAATESTQLEL